MENKERGRIEGFVTNPILPGFHPDPDIIRVGSDFYITTTTFEWFPGIPIHHSTNLRDWKLIGHALHSRQMDLSPVGDSQGNYIPSLAWHDGTFYLVYSIVYDGAWPHVANRSFLITAKDIRGPWSDPVYLNSVAFDPAIFIDDDGRTYIISLEMETRLEKGPQMKGFRLQEWDGNKAAFAGDAHLIFETADHGLAPEGPHLYHIDDYYYLMCAIGGTKWEHATLFLRSKNLPGPYEAAPAPMLSSRSDPQHPLQKAGQGCLVQSPTGQWYLAHHASRPLAPARVCPLGRETCLQPIRWNADGWPELAHGGTLPAVSFDLNTHDTRHPEARLTGPNVAEDFTAPSLDPEWSFLRDPPSHDWVRLHPQEGKLSLRGRQPIAARFQQSIVARRWTSTHFTAETKVSFQPHHHRQMAGLICYYDTTDFAYAYLSLDEEEGFVVSFIQRMHGLPWHKCPQLVKPIAIPEPSVSLRARVYGDALLFSFQADPSAPWQALSPELDATHLSDEGRDGSLMRFTGAMIGMAAHDPITESTWAHFHHFTLRHAETA